MIRLLVSTAIALVACTQAAPIPSPSVTTVTVTLYYKESQAEPWSATPTGSTPTDWRNTASQALAAAGLHPLSVDQVRTQPADSVTCQSAQCPNLHALRVLLPVAERQVAADHCFVTDPQDPTPPAIRRSDCSPLFKP